MSFATLRPPFATLTSETFIARGSAGQVFAISSRIVFKCPTLFINPAPDQARESEESVQKIEHEKAVYNILMQHQHRNIVRGLLCIPEGIFLQRLECTLHACLENHQASSIRLDRQCRWIRQITSATQFLESLGYVHGDLRPANILLDAMDTIKVGDFDSTVKRGEQLLVTTVPFCKLSDDYEPPLAGAMSEQYAVGSCIYNIRTGHQPYHNVAGPVMVRKLMNDEFPSTSEDKIFGDIIIQCWRGRYQSVAQLERDILERLRSWNQELDSGTGPSAMEGPAETTEPSLVAECEKFLRQERE